MACRIASALLLLFATDGLRAQTPPQSPAAPACTTDQWSVFWPTITRATERFDRRRIELPDMQATTARIMPDGVPQRFRLDESFNPQSQFLSVWLYPAPERIAGAGAVARTVSDQRGIRLAASVPRRPADLPVAWDVTVTLPTIGSAGLPKHGWLSQQVTLVVVGCVREGNEPIFLATVEFEMSDGRVARAIAAGGVALVYALAAGVAATGRRRSAAGLARPGTLASLNPIVVTQDAAGHGSLSRLQILFFTLIVLGTLFYLFLRTGVVANLSADLLWLLGIPGAGTVLAQTVAGSRAPRGSVPVAALTWLAAHGVLAEARAPRVRDLFFSGGEFDIYKLQNLVFSPFVGLTVLAAGVSDLAALDIPDNLMALLGLSQVVYVGGKAVQPAPSAEAIAAAVAAAEEAELALQAAYAATRATLGPAGGIEAALARVPAEAAAFRNLARLAAETYAQSHEEDLQLRTPLPLLEL